MTNVDMVPLSLTQYVSGLLVRHLSTTLSLIQIPKYETVTIAVEAGMLRRNVLQRCLNERLIARAK